MSTRMPAFPSPVPGAEVRKQAPALYWLTYEPALPRGCAACPFATITVTDPENPMAGKATCRLGQNPFFVEEMQDPPCDRANWQWRARQEIGTLWLRLMVSDEELAEIAAELGAPSPDELAKRANALSQAVIRAVDGQRSGRRRRTRKPEKGE